MKKLIYSSILLLFSYAHSQAQNGWEVLTDNYPEVTLRDVYANHETVIAVGSIIRTFTPIILSSFDGGETWDTTQFNNGPLFRTITFSDAQHGIIGSVNTSSCILRSTDYGKTWKWHYCDTDSSFTGINQVSFINSQMGYLAGWGKTAFSDGTVYKTLDGGETWTNVSGNLLKQPFEYLQFIDEKNGFGGSNLFGSSNLYRTTDGGKTWTDLPVSDLSFSDAHFFNVNEGVMVSERYIRKTTDGGESWTTLQKVGGVLFADVEFLTEKMAYAVGARRNTSDNTFMSKIYFTNDGGETWTEEGEGIADYVGKVRFYNGRAYAVSSSGVVLRSRQLGPTNVDQPNATGGEFIVVFPNPTSGQVQLRLDKPNAQAASAELFNYQGNRMMVTQNTQKAAGITLNVEALPAGVYMVVVADRNRNLYRKKFIKS